MTPKQAIQKYGKKAWRMMPRYLADITINKLPNGDEDLSEFELDKAFEKVIR